jgi:methylglutaconyl-CoA hydratase
MKHLSVLETNGVCTVMLNRPDKHNAFHPEMIGELTETFLRLENEKSVRVVILKGAGKSFSAGGDLEWMRSMVDFSFDENIRDAQKLFDMFQAMADCTVPLIGVVHGNVMGGGLGLVSVCDMVACDEKTQFSFSEARIGIAPAVISPFVLRKINQGHARQLMLTAKIFSAEEAKAAGLVHFVGDGPSCGKYIESAVTQFRECAPEAVREAKRLMNYISSHPWPQFRDRAAQVIAERRVSAEGQEGLKAFLEKRTPHWKAP